MACIRNCQVCPNLVAVTEVTVGTTSLELTIPTQNITNKERICLYSQIAIPSSTLPVTITNGTDVINLITPCGNLVRADQLRTRRIYNVYIATDSSNAIVRSNNLCPTAFVFPVLTGA